MLKYAFILGRNPILSVSEIFSLEQVFKLDFKIIDLTSEILIVETEKLEIEKWQSRLGGVIKIAEITKEFKDSDDLLESLQLDNLLPLISQTKKKIIFGFSLYGERVKHLHQKFNEIGLDLKRELQVHGFGSRFVYSTDYALSSVQITRNKILEKGAEILVISGIHGFYLGKTLTVQDYRDYSQKDYGRPKRDIKSGLLPPKLAKIMINLSQTKQNEIILDPFCGSGTILQEAILMGYQNVIGSDIDHKAIRQTEENLNWLTKNYKLPETKHKLILSDIKNLHHKILPHSINAIITEPYLGPTLKGKPLTDKITKIKEELELLYLEAFKTFKKILKQKAKVVIILPLFKTEDGVFTLRILEILEKKGFFRINPIPEKISLFAKISPTARGSLIYQRPDQKVEREVFIFQNQND